MLEYELVVNGLKDTAIVTFHVQCTIADCDIPIIITPNGDGVNDYFVIDCAINYPNNELTVYNRWGNEVYSQKTYNNNWDANYRGDNLPDGTYYYVFKTNNSNDDKKVGFIQVSH